MMNRQTEYLLTLIGAILNALFAFVVILITGLAGIGMSSQMNQMYDTDYYNTSYYDGSEGAFIVGILIVVVIWLVATSIFGFIAAFKLKKGHLGWGIAILVLGGLSITSIHGILWVIAGIMTLTRTNKINGNPDLLTDDLSHLKKLYDEGMITKDEYEKKKNEWLNF
ncbi:MULTISPECIES: DUF4064 domain-containing protein [Carnobacterium]|uniref:DUF4064 domain-containing protein n=1 Tax=Carnobacterium TaxID=2747 RepID=UPI001EE79942|nr:MULTISPECIES: DUF4064 domain-containing protein [Carnobacterium]MDT1940403.1 DUF4064 domain-containing protein [Carnobacterium divergens]MDT1942841.1 DUF4064 domain-containing protein [Carnobacterium divergens]MDT1948647.1 DUF4064 domain-containing protein [Carnobacterium divergens]MDT1951128.1 DUF4064 domain-containing protein [Carnobacterium divergens]MDT1956186.1 DUF4064 domain-containing protein [Carnobacterium divergens]